MARRKPQAPGYFYASSYLSFASESPTLRGNRCRSKPVQTTYAQVKSEKTKVKTNGEHHFFTFAFYLLRAQGLTDTCQNSERASRFRTVALPGAL